MILDFSLFYFSPKIKCAGLHGQISKELKNIDDSPETYEKES